VAVRWFVFLEIACWRERVRLIIEDRCCLDTACPTFVAYRKWYEQILVSFEESGENLFNEQKKLSCGRLSDSTIIGRMLQRVIENNTAKISDYKPCADNLKISRMIDNSNHQDLLIRNRCARDRLLADRKMSVVADRSGCLKNSSSENSRKELIARGCPTKRFSRTGLDIFSITRFEAVCAENEFFNTTGPKHSLNASGRAQLDR